MSTDTPKTSDSDAEIRGRVRREVTGLTYEHLGSLIAAEGDETAGRGDHGTAVRMMELRRIRTLVSQQAFAADEGYTPAGDPEERRQGHPASGGVRPPEQRGLYEVLARCTDSGHPGVSEITTLAEAGSVEEAVAAVHRAKGGSLYGTEGLYRVVEAFEDTPSNSARHMEQARAQAAAEIGLAAAAAYKATPEGAGPSDGAALDVLADFFHRTVVHPWHFAHPGDPGDGSTPPYPPGTDYGRNLARLLLAHLNALDMPLPGATVRSDSTLPPHTEVTHRPDPARISPHHSQAAEDQATWQGATAAVLDRAAVLAAAERCPWALAAQEMRHWPDGSFLDTALSAVRPEEYDGYAGRLEEFAQQHRARLEDLLRAYGPGSTPASHGRYALIGQPETLVILERMETAPLLLRGTWEDREEDIFLDDLEFAWGPSVRLSRR
ncbi:hypothetical protein [Streptomyces sp. NPDC059611]|uniref:hypothetical protein n=1 Tax=Streptomyces sp. NPDC059611 TaxID=3346884 RepID=UPI0036BFD6C8